MYKPKPIDTSKVEVPEQIVKVVEEKIAPHIHDVWAINKIKNGYVYGKKTDDKTKTHADLKGYSELSSEIQDYDVQTAMGTIRALYALGYTINKQRNVQDEFDAVKI